MTPKELSAKLEAAAARLSGVERKRMPGGYALFVGGKIFANITVDGRIGVKLTVPWCLEDLAKMPGAGPWTLGKKLMENWVLLPPALAADDTALRKWVDRAYGCAMGTVPAQRPDSFAPPTARSTAPEATPQRERREVTVTPVSVAPPARGPRSSRPSLPPVPIPSRPPSSPSLETPALPPVPQMRIPPPPRSSRPLVSRPASPGSGYDLSSYAPPPPSSVGIRVVPRDAKSPYEETLVGVPAPSSSKPLDEPGSEPPAEDGTQDRADR